MMRSNRQRMDRERFHACLLTFTTVRPTTMPSCTPAAPAPTQDCKVCDRFHTNLRLSLTGHPQDMDRDSQGAGAPTTGTPSHTSPQEPTGSEAGAHGHIEAALQDVSSVNGERMDTSQNMDLGSDGEVLEENNEESVRIDGGEQHQDDEDEAQEDRSQEGRGGGGENEKDGEEGSRAQGSRLQGPGDEKNEEEGEEEMEGKFGEGDDIIWDQPAVRELADAVTAWSTMIPSVHSTPRDGRLRAGACWSVVVDRQNPRRVALRNRSQEVVQTFPCLYQPVLELLCKHITFHACSASAMKTYLGKWRFPATLRDMDGDELEDPWAQFGGEVNLAIFLINVRQAAMRWQAQYDSHPATDDDLLNLNPYLQTWGVAVYYSPRDCTVSGMEIWERYVIRSQVDSEFPPVSEIAYIQQADVMLGAQNLTGRNGQRGGGGASC